MSTVPSQRGNGLHFSGSVLNKGFASVDASRVCADVTGSSNPIRYRSSLTVGECCSRITVTAQELCIRSRIPVMHRIHAGNESSMLSDTQNARLGSAACDGWCQPQPDIITDRCSRSFQVRSTPGEPRNRNCSRVIVSRQSLTSTLS